jgi:RNA polymerase sigma factor (TIGR02999 family)
MLPELKGCHAARKGSRRNAAHPDRTLGRALTRETRRHQEPVESSSNGADASKALHDTPRDALDQLVPVVYEHLRAIARRQLALRPGGGTLSTTGLVHEAYIKLANQANAGWRDRGHFFAIASVAMRHVLVDRAKSRLAQKRGGARHRVTLDDDQLPADDQPEALLELNDAVERLAAVEPRLARVVECRFFGGLSEAETAEALGITTRTVQRDWSKARMLLRRALA